MRMYFLATLLFYSSAVFGQVGYNCNNQSNLKANWQYLGPFNYEHELMHQRFGNVSCISVNPTDTNEIYVGSPTGALMHTTNRGVSWHSLTDNMDVPIIGINDLIVDFTKMPHEILMVTGSQNEWYDTPDFGIFKSINGGQSWSRKKVSEDGIFSPVYYKLVQHKNLIFSYGQKSVILSKDGGDSWTRIINDKTVVNKLEIKEREIRYIHYEPSEDKLYFSTIQKWTSKGNENAKVYTFALENGAVEDLTPLLEKTYQTQNKNNGLEAIQIIPYKKGKLLFAASHHSSQEIYNYEYSIAEKKIIDYEVPNGGNMSGASLRWFKGFDINKKNTQVRYLAGVYLYKSIDGGQTYKRLFNYSFGDNGIPHVDIRSLNITNYSADGESDHIYIGTDGGLSFSTDGGKSFRNLNGKELQLTQFYGLGSSPFNGTISAGSQDNSIITYIPEDKKWIYNVMGDGYDVAYSKVKPGHAYGQYNSRAMQSTINDIVPFSKRLNLAQESSSNRKTIFTHPNGDLFFAAKSLFQLPKNESKWIEHKTPMHHKALAMEVSITNPNVIYMSGNWNGLIKSQDGGKTWEDLSEKLLINGFKQTARVQSICISPYDENRIFIGFGYMGTYDNLCKETIRVIESNDGGKTWTNSSLGLPIFAVHDLKFYEGSYESLFAATDQGVYFKRGAGYKWQKFSNNMPMCLIGELNINYCRGKLTAATYGRGLWETDLPPIKDKNPMIIRGKKTFTAPKGEALVINQDIIIRGRCKLTIDCPVYMPKGSKIRVKRKSQVEITKNGQLINGCGDNWHGIVEK